MRLAIADPPYPPMFGVRYDLAGGRGRVTMRSRATRYYGDQPGSSDVHPEAAKWDDLAEHRKLLEHLLDNYDGWAIATTPDGLGAYHPLPIEARIMAWVKPTAQPGPSRLRSTWEPVIVFIPEARRRRRYADHGPQVTDTATAPADGDELPNPVLRARVEQVGFVGAKPAAWTEWVLEALGYDPATDTVDDLFPGSGSVAAAVAQREAVAL